ncbi:MAG: hypothetical protein E6K19_01790 [Methanobacteriota archaeon]|nr:MAG: hypothetical protein E6K19_01790 [Euryarchaeota archaeon]
MLGSIAHRAKPRLAITIAPPAAKRVAYPATLAMNPPRTGATTATVVKVAVRPASLPARFPRCVVCTSSVFIGSQKAGT